jgi:tRNA(fMet)-specific endonuclease VapC
VKYLFDTDHVSILQRQRGPDFERLLARTSQLDPFDVGVSVISFHEQTLGCNSYLAKAKTPANFVKGYDRFVELLSKYSQAIVVPFDTDAASLYEALRSQRIRVKAMDLRIASTAISSGLTLLTRNTVDFERVPGLRIEDWTR